MTQDNAKPTILSSPEAILLAAAEKIAALKLQTKALNKDAIIPEYVDPLETAKVNSPLLQYLESTKGTPIKPAVELEYAPNPVEANELPTLQNWDYWQAINQIEALGFEVGDKVYIRLLPGKGINPEQRKAMYIAKSKDFALELLPEDTFNGKQFKLIPLMWKETGHFKPDGTPKHILVEDQSKATLDWATELTKLNRKGYGLYLIPNKGGRLNRDITHFQSVFYEIDDISFYEQKQLIKDFGKTTGVKPSIVIRTRKGYHVYFKFARSDWQLPNWEQEVAIPTTLVMNSDKSVTSNANLMRLAGFYHAKYERGEFNFLPVDLKVCEPDRVYTRAQYLKALKDYSGCEFSKKKLEIASLVFNPSHNDYRYIDSDQLIPQHHQILGCPDEFLEELHLRTRIYLQLLKLDHAGERVFVTDAWIEDPSKVIEAHKLGHQSPSNYDNDWDENSENFTVRWAQYLYGYNPNGRDGWITAQDPLVPESEQDSHSLDSLHINASTGALKSHRNSYGDNKAIWAAMKDRAFKANPDEEKFYKAYHRNRLKAKGFSKKLEGEISKEEYQNRNLKPELTEQELQEQTVNLVEYSAAKDAKKEQEFVDYLERLKIKRLRARKYYECNEEKLSKETYSQFPTIEECNKEGQILALKAPKGTGKSTRIKQYIDEARAACWLTVSVTLRRNLGLAQSHDWDIKWVDEDGMEGFFQGQCNTMSCCWDSLHKFIKADYRDKEILLIIDEVESGLDHLSTATTIGNKGKRVEIYQELRRILAHIAKCGGLVIAADADLSDSSVEFLQTIGKTLPVTVIENHYLEKKRSVKVFNCQDGQVKLAIRDAIQFGLPFLFASDSIEGAKGMHDYARKYLESINCPELLDKIWLINSETGHFQENKTRIVDINKAIREQEPIALFYTPTINVGVSIDGSHFREGFGIFKGTIIADAARQMIARNREVINWVLFADNTANKSKLSEDVLIDPAQIKLNVIDHVHATQLRTAHISKKLIEEELRETSVNKGAAYTELARKLETDKASFDTAEFHLLANILAKNNYQWKNFHKVFCHGMESEGWKVESLKGSKTGFCEELKELRAERVKQESETIASSDHTQIISQESTVPTRLEYDIANDILRTSENRAMRAAAYKVKVAYWCKVDINRVDAELVELIKFNHRWLSGVKFQMYLQNEEIIKTIDGYKINKMAQQYSETGLIAAGDLDAKAVQVAAIKEFGLLDIIDLNDDEQTFKLSDFNPLLKKLKNYTNKDLKKWGEKCGIPVKSRQLFKNPIGLIVKPMLAKMGYSMVLAKKDAKGDRYYRIPAEEINCLARAMTLEGMLADWAEQQTQRRLRLTAAAEVNLEQNTTDAVLEPASSESQYQHRFTH